MVFRKKRKDPFKEIQSCLQKRDYKGALDWFNTLLQKDSKNTQIRLRFADTLVLAGNKKEAIKQLRIVADELANKGFMIRAIAINKKILQIDPRQTDVQDKLAEMKEERSEPVSRPRLADALTRPDAPLRRASEEAPAPAEPIPAPPPKAEEPPQVLPDLEESMAMEFGDTGEMPVPDVPVPDVPVVEAPVVEAPPPETPAEPLASGGFELTEDVASSPANETPLDEEPSFTEEPIELGAGAEPEPSADVELKLDGLDEPPSSPEIVLDIEAPAEAAPAEVAEIIEVVEEVEVVADEVEPEVLEIAAETEEPQVVLGGEEMEVIEFEAESEPEPEVAADLSEALVGALGEDIDSLIDSIIDDVGSSAKGEQPTDDEPPTHIPLFSDLTTPEFIDVALLLVRRVVKVGEQAVKEGDPGDSMFIISTGEVRATVERDGRQVAVATLRDGDFFGEMAVLSGEPRTATVTAVKNTEVLELSRENLREICSRHPHVEAKIRLAYDERVSSDRGR